MRAVVTTAPNTLQLIQTPIPEPAAGQIRARVIAAGVNSVDIATSQGIFHQLGYIHQPEHTGIGWDLAGTVDALGAGVAGPAIGTAVAAVTGTFDLALGAYADYIVLDAHSFAVVPPGLDPIAAATIPLNALTADQALDLIDPEVLGRRLLITGAAGAVGGFAVTLASRRGWHVSALARSTDTDFLTSAGAHEVLTELPTEPVFDAAFDPASLAAPVLAAIRPDGGYVGVVPAAVPDGARGITTAAVTMHPDGPRLAELLTLVTTGALQARIAGTLPLADAAQAHANVAKGAQRGRWVLLP
jgi:NADPH:quinone reductase-like Zn-dependent oxidoreductase